MVVDLNTSCNYRIGSLKPFILLLPKDKTDISYTIDNHNGRINSISAEEILKIECQSVRFTQNETTGKRLDFSSTVIANLVESYGESWISLTERLRFGEFYVVVEDMQGVQFIQTPEFTSDFSYTYTFQSSNAHNAELRFDVSSNVPVLPLNTVLSPTEEIGQCAMHDGGIVNLWLTPINHALVTANGNVVTQITCTDGEGLHSIQFDRGSFNFTQTYSRNGYTERLTFTVPFEKNVNTWGYNLHEFNENKYLMMFSTTDGNYFVSGGEFGFLPNYDIETSESSSESNFIQITLNHSGQNTLLYNDEKPLIVESTTDIYVPITETIQDPVTGEDLPYKVCISKSEAVYTLVQMMTETLTPTDRYKCLEGYETTYQNLRIVGTYESDSDEFDFPLIFESNECSYKDNCQLKYMPKTVYVYRNAGDSYTTPVYGLCPWEIHSLPDWIRCDITEGQGGIHYNVTFTSTLTGTPTPVVGYGYIQSFDNLGLIQFICQKEPDWYKPYNFEINAAEQTVTVNVFESHDKYTVCEIPEGMTYKKIYGTRKLEIYVPENTDDANSQQFNIKLCSPYHEDGYVTITQRPIYYQWREVVGEYLCDEGSSYKKLRKYKGYEADDINIWTGEQRTGSLLVVDDERCRTEGGGDAGDYIYEWVQGYTSCQGPDLYSASRKRESFDRGETWQWTDEYELGELIEEDAQECSEEPTERQYKMVLDESMYECDGYNSYYMECQWYSYNGQDWFKVIEPAVCQRSDIIKTPDDVSCGFPMPDPSFNERWISAPGYICLNGAKWSRLRLQISTDGGVTWQDTDIYSQNREIEPSSDDCQDAPEPTYGWIPWEGKKICDGVDSYTAKRYAYTWDNVTWYVFDPPRWVQDQLIMEDDPSCGYTPEGKYRWNKSTGFYVCVDGNKYDRWDEEVSYDMGDTWTKTGISEIGYLVEEHSTWCDSVVSTYEYRLTTNWQCNGFDSYYMENRWESQDGGYTWFEDRPVVSRMSDVMRLKDDPECGSPQPVEPIYRFVEVPGEFICE